MSIFIVIVFTGVVETLIQMFYFKVIFNTKLHFIKHVLPGLIFGIVVGIVVYVFTVWIPDELIILKSVFSLVSFILFFRLIFNASILRQCIPILLIYIATACISDIFVGFLFSALNIDVSDFNKNPWLNLLGNFLIWLGSMFFLLLIRYFQLFRYYPKTIRKKALLLSISYISFILLIWLFQLNVFVQKFLTESARFSDYLTMIIAILSSTVFSFFNIHTFRDIENKKNDLDIKDREIEYQRFYNNNLETILQDIRRFKHGYDNTLATLQGYVEMKQWEDLGQFIHEICENKEKTAAIDHLMAARIKNGGIIGLLTQKMYKAQENGVLFKIAVKNEVNEINMKITDLCESLAILLDNAIEAAESSLMKYVKFDVECDEWHISFSIENSIKDKPDLYHMFEKGYTTKPDGNGIGLWIVKNTVEKYSNVYLNTIIQEDRVIQEICISK